MVGSSTRPPEDPNGAASQEQSDRARRERGYDDWCKRLVAEGDRALVEFVDQHPMVDPPHLRKLLRRARRDPGSGKSRQALRSVLKLIREASEIEASVRRATANDDG